MRFIIGLIFTLFIIFVILGVIFYTLAIIVGGAYIAYYAVLAIGLLLVYGLPPIIGAIITNVIFMKSIPISKAALMASKQANPCDIIELECKLFDQETEKPKIEARVKSYELLQDVAKKNIPRVFRIFPILSFFFGISVGQYIASYMLSNKQVLKILPLAMQKLFLYVGMGWAKAIVIALVVITSLITTLLLTPSFRLESFILDNLKTGLDKIHGDIDKLVFEIKNLPNDLSGMYEFLYYYPSFESYIYKAEQKILERKCDVINNPYLILEILKEFYREAEQEHDRLKKVLNLYKKAKRLIKEAESRRNFILNLLFPNKRIEKLKMALFDGNIAFFVHQNRWDDCFKYIESIIKEAHVILGDEEQEEEQYYYQKFEHDEEEYKRRQERYQEQEDEYSFYDIDIQKAYKILGVSMDASPEEIKRAYRKLAAYWHPDAGNTDSDEKMKEINLAYDIIKKYKNFN